MKSSRSESLPFFLRFFLRFFAGFFAGPFLASSAHLTSQRRIAAVLARLPHTAEAVRGLAASHNIMPSPGTNSLAASAAASGMLAGTLAAAFSEENETNGLSRRDVVRTSSAGSGARVRDGRRARHSPSRVAADAPPAAPPDAPPTPPPPPPTCRATAQASQGHVSYQSQIGEGDGPTRASVASVGAAAATAASAFESSSSSSTLNVKSRVGAASAALSTTAAPAATRVKSDATDRPAFTAAKSALSLACSAAHLSFASA